MGLEVETEYNTSYYRCIDPIENFKIKVILQPVKTLHIPLPQLDVEHSSLSLFSYKENQSNIEEYILKWQEKIFSKSEIEKYSNDYDWKQKLNEKYCDNITNGLNNLKDYSTKVFTHVEADKCSISNSDLDIFKNGKNYISSLTKNMKDTKINVSYCKHYKNISKRKIINYYPSEEFKKQTHLINKNVQKMFILVDLGSRDVENKFEQDQCDGILCSLCYDHSNLVLQVTPSFSKSKFRPYTIGNKNNNGKNYYYYWIYHESLSIKSENLTKEVQLMKKVFDYQEVIKKLQLDAEFHVGKPDHFYMTIFGEIISAQDFEYDNLHVHYYIKLPSGWGYNNTDSSMGRTQTCYKSSQGICYFSYLFEMNFCVDFNFLTDSLSSPLELFFEVLSVDKYKRYRNEGYANLIIPTSPGMFTYSLKCWRILDQTITSQLERFFIGGGPELEDVSYVGLWNSGKAEIMSRLGLQTHPSGIIDVKLNILHQSSNFVIKKDMQVASKESIMHDLDTGSLLGSVNAVLQAFRRARERMLEAKKGLQTNFSFIFPENEGSSKKCD